MDLFEAMGTARAIRLLKPDPLPPEMVERLLWAATRAPSPGNSQGWDFIVVDDPAKKQRIAEAISGQQWPTAWPPCPGPIARRGSCSTAPLGSSTRWTRHRSSSS